MPVHTCAMTAITWMAENFIQKSWCEFGFVGIPIMQACLLCLTLKI